jgi:hypothetical protein
MAGPSPWDPHEDQYGCTPWTPIKDPVPFSKTEFKIFKLSDSDTDDDGRMFDRVQWSTIPDESDFEEE